MNFSLSFFFILLIDTLITQSRQTTRDSGDNNHLHEQPPYTLPTQTKTTPSTTTNTVVTLPTQPAPHDENAR